MRDKRLGEFLRQVFNWSWDEFARAEHDRQYSTSQSIVFTLIRACAIQKLPAIRLALSRLDGKLKTPVQIEMPKVFYLYPNAKAPEGEPLNRVDEASGGINIIPQLSEGEVLSPPEIVAPDPERLDEMSLREVLAMMSDLPRELPQQLIAAAEQTERWLKHNDARPTDIPRVKSVVAAHLLIMAQARNIDALAEVFDQIDGKLVETIQILGEDIYITIYSATAPPGARLNADGILQIEATDSQVMWANKLGGGERDRQT